MPALLPSPSPSRRASCCSATAASALVLLLLALLSGVSLLHAYAGSARVLRRLAPADWLPRAGGAGGATAAPPHTCRVALHSLGAPSAALPSECRPETLRAMPSGAAPGDVNLLLSRYRVSRYLADAVSDAAAAAAAVSSSSSAAPPAELLLIDDREFDAVLACLNARRWAPNGTENWERLWPRLLAEHGARILAVLGDATAPPSARAPRVLAAETWPSDEWQRVDLSHPRLYRLVVDTDHIPRPQRRAVGTYMLVPYAPRIRRRDGGGSNDDPPGDAAPSPPPPPALLFFEASCGGGSMGMRMRTRLIDALAPLPGVAASCLRRFKPQAVYLRELAAARFCLLLAGDTPSTTRVAEVLLSPCVPVFAGPPWPLLPLLPAVDYAAFAVFVNLTQPAAWLTGADAAELAAPDSLWGLEPRTRALLGGLAPPALLLQAADAAALVDGLRAIPRAAVQRLQRAAEPFKRYFGEEAGSSAPGRAGAGAAAVLEAVCEGVREAAAAAASSSGGAS